MLNLNHFAVGLYLLVASAWLIILAVFLRKLFVPKLQGRFFLILNMIMVVDASRTLFETFYFGGLQFALAGLLPQKLVRILVEPQYVSLPKVVNLLAALFILYLLHQEWFTTEEREVARREENLCLLKESEERYRLLFENMIGAYAMGQMVYDDEGRPVDFKYLQINVAFETMFSLSREDVEGRLLSEVFPGVNSDPSGWVHHFHEVVTTGETKALKEYSEALEMWFYVNAFHVEGDRFVTIFTDITPIMAAERLHGALELAGAASHELGQPLQAALGHAELIELKLLGEIDPSGISRNLEGFKDQVERMKKISTRLRSVSRYRTKEHARERIFDLANDEPEEGWATPGGEVEPPRTFV